MAINMASNESSVYQNIPAPSPNRGARTNPRSGTTPVGDPVYENLEEKKFHRASPKVPPKQSNIPPRLSPRPNNYSPQVQRKQKYENVQLQTIPGPHGWRPERPAADGESGDELDVTEMFDSVLEVAEEEERKRTNGKKSGSVMNFVNHLNTHNKNLPQRRTPPGQNSGRGGQAPRAVVQPTVQREGQFIVSLSVGDIHDSTNSSITYSSYVKGGHSNFQSIDDVPAEIDSLTVEDVSQCLRLLNMDSHISTFCDHQVDGGLLTGLKEQTLVRDFGLTDFNASKLMRFARGWRPKVT